MKELAKHIEVLLLDNDCVIIPGFGGFIAHYQSAAIDEATAIISPPQRTIGFNTRLVINDGLLVQSYMNTHHTDFPDATRKIEETVYQLKEKLYQEGECTLERIGTLYYNIQGEYEFSPLRNIAFMPYAYGMEAVTALAPYVAEPVVEKEEEVALPVATPARTWKTAWQYVAAAAVVAVGFLAFSPAIENTAVERYEYASLGSDMLLGVAQEPFAAIAPASQNVRPVAVRAEKVPAAKKKTTPATQPSAASSATAEPMTKPAPAPATAVQPVTKSYHVITASLNRIADAEAEVARLQKLGYTHARVLSSTKLHRVSVGSHTSADDARQQMKEIRQNLGECWMLEQ